MKGKKSDYRLMTSLEKRNGDGKIYTTIGAAWIVGQNAISIRFEALPRTENAVLIPITDSDDNPAHDMTGPGTDFDPNSNPY